MGSSVLVAVFVSLEAVLAVDVLNRKSYQFQEVFYGDISQTLQTQIYVYYDCTHREKFYSLSRIEDS